MGLILERSTYYEIFVHFHLALVIVLSEGYQNDYTCSDSP